jgi:hypothetical protein
MKTTKKSPKPSEKPIEPELEYILPDAQIIRNPILRWLFNIVPLAVVAATTVTTFAGWYSKVGVDLFYLSGGLTIVLCILFTRTLFEKFPQVFVMIWRRGVLCPKQNGIRVADKASRPLMSNTLLSFTQAASDRMNDSRQIVCGALGISVVLWTIWLLDKDVLESTYMNFHSIFSGYGTIALIRLTFILAAFVGGLIAWRIIVIADTVAKLGKQFDFDLQINHPDGCGGLRPIGDLCLGLAYSIAPVPIMLGAWLVFINFLDIRFLRMDPNNLAPLSSTIVFLMIPVAILCVFSFFFPLGSIHTSMLRAKSRLQIELDEISQEIHQLSSKLLIDANRLAPQEGTSVEEKIEFLKRVYAHNSQIPTWPYRSTHIWGLISTQIVPSLGVISSIVGFIKGFGK